MFKRVQVKSTRSEGEIISCRLKSSNNWQVKKYTAEEIDYFAIYEAIKKEGYLIPISDVEGMTEISLRKGAAKNNQKKGIRQAENYQYF